MNSTITVVGRLVRDPETRFTAAGVAVTSFTLAWNDRRKTAAGEWEDGDAHFLDVSAWRALAESAAELRKGQRVLVTGELKSRTWEQDGAKRTAWQVVAEEVGIALDKFARRESAPAPRPPSADPWATSSVEPPF